MRRTRLAAALLIAATVGIAACSKSEEAKQEPPKSPEPAHQKPAVGRPAAVTVTTDGEGIVGTVTPPTLPPKITGTFADGEAAYQAKKYADATAIFEGYAERRPANPWGHYMVGLSAWKSGDLAKSEQAFEKALSVDPHHVKSLVNLSRVFIDQKRHDEAVDRLTRASEIEPESADIFRMLGRTYHAQRKTDEAIQAYRQAIDLDERDAWSLNNLGLLLLEARRADEAVPLLTSAVEIRKNVPEFHNNLGMALEHTGRFSAAASSYSDALGIDPGYAKAKQNLTRVEAIKSGPEETLAITDPAAIK
jgi:tetratricopeptide (TPR) repeat protein